VVLRFALAAVLGISACSDDTGGNDNLPNPGDLNGPGSSTELRQTATLSGDFAGAIRIEGQGWPADGGSQELTLTFQLEALADVGQAELRVRPEPAAAFDLTGASFAAAQPFITFGNGVQLETHDGGSELRIGGASLGTRVSGDAPLGTLTIRTSSDFASHPEATLVVTALSLGPSSSQRDVYDRSTLNLGVRVGGN
jgi:hypothetical protein